VVKLGNPNRARALRGKQTGNREAVAAIGRKAQECAGELRSIVDDVRAHGITSVRKIADELNERGALAPRGGALQPTTVVRPSPTRRGGNKYFLDTSLRGALYSWQCHASPSWA
jgi:hypothetical protein